MKQYMEDRIIKEAEMMIDKDLTIRSVAELVGVSKSTVHKDLCERLMHLNYGLYVECQKVIQENKAVRHLRGGEATKRKFRHFD